MKYRIETRVLPGDNWSRISGDYEINPVFQTARLLASTRLEVRIFDQFDNQVFQYRKQMGTASAHSTKQPRETTALRNSSASTETGSQTKGAVA